MVDQVSLAQALTISDQEFVKYLQKFGDTLGAQLYDSTSGKAKPNKLDVHLVERTSENSYEVIDKLNMGFKARIGDTENNADKNHVNFSPEMCVSCLPPDRADALYGDGSFNDPKQRRGTELMRAYVGLHETAHKLTHDIIDMAFKGEQSPVPAEFEKNPSVVSYFNDHFASAILGPKNEVFMERVADTFALGVMIRELGPEGVLFAKQILSGSRYIELGENSGHDTASSIATLIKLAESDPGALQKMSLAEIANASVFLAAITTPKREEQDILEAEMKKNGVKLDAGFLSDNDGVQQNYQKVYQGAQDRLQWYIKAAGQPVNKQALQIYEQFYMPGDSTLLSPEGINENMDKIVAVSPYGKDKDAKINSIEMKTEQFRSSALAALSPHSPLDLRPESFSPQVMAQAPSFA